MKPCPENKAKARGMDDRSRQSEELEALKAIYDSDFRTVNAREDTYGVRIRCPTVSVELQFILPSDYPSSSPPVYELSLPWVDVEEAQYIAGQLFGLFNQSKGEVIVHQWVEWVREYVTTKTGGPEKESESDDTTEEVATGSVPCSDTAADHSRRGGLKAAVECPAIVHGEPMVDRKSTFQAHAAKVTAVEEVEAVLAQLKTNKKIASATHNILAYRLCSSTGDKITQDYDDDGETSAGGKLLNLLELMDVRNVMVVVTRWYGGIFLYGDRFKHVNNVAKTILKETGLGLEHKDSQDAVSSNKSKSKTKHRKH